MLTRPLNDIRCLWLILLMVLERISQSEIQNIARQLSWFSVNATRGVTSIPHDSVIGVKNLRPSK